MIRTSVSLAAGGRLRLDSHLYPRFRRRVENWRHRLDEVLILIPEFHPAEASILRKAFFLFILTAALGYGGTSDTYQGEKSPGTALAWSALGTMTPVALGLSLASMSDDATLPFILVSGGLAVGPSLGEFYAASAKRGLAGVGLRMAGGFAFFYVAAKSAPGSGTGHPLALIGLAAYLGSTAYSFYNAPAAVKRYNSTLRTRAELGWAPILLPGTDGSMRTGGLAYLRF